VKFTIQELLHSKSTQRQNRLGDWVPARPINWKYENFFTRLCNAWDVFKGRADLVYWDDLNIGKDEQPERKNDQ